MAILVSAHASCCCSGPRKPRKPNTTISLACVSISTTNGPGLASLASPRNRPGHRLKQHGRGGGARSIHAARVSRAGATDRLSLGLVVGAEQADHRFLDALVARSAHLRTRAPSGETRSLAALDGHLDEIIGPFDLGVTA